MIETKSDSNRDRAKRLDEENISLKRRIVELDISHKMSEEKGQELQSQLQHAQEQILNLESAPPMEPSIQVELESFVESAGDGIEAELLKRDLEDLKEKNVQLEKQLRLANDAKAQLQAQVDDRDKKLKENDESILDLQRRIQELTIRLQKAGDQTDGQGIVASLRAQKDALERDNQMLRKELEATKSTLTEVQKRRAEAESQLYQIKRKLNDSELKLNMANTQNENLHQELLRAQEKNHNLEAERDRALHEQANLRGELAEIQDRLQRTKSELESSKMQVRDLQGEIQTLKRELDDSQSKINWHVNNERQLKEEITSLKRK